MELPGPTSQRDSRGWLSWRFLLGKWKLKSFVRQNVAIAQTPIISVEIAQQALGSAAGNLPSFDEARDEFTRNYLVQILQITGGNVSQAARLAKRNRTDFYKLLSRHQLSPDEFKSRGGTPPI